MFYTSSLEPNSRQCIGNQSQMLFSVLKHVVTNKTYEVVQNW